MKNLKNFVQYNEEENWRDKYPTVGSKAAEEAEDKKWFNIGDDSMDNEEESGIEIYTVEELFDIDDDDQHIEVIKLDDLSDEQKEYLGIKNI